MNHQQMVANPAKYLAQALTRRGFLVKVENDQVIFSAGNGKRDFEDVRQELERSGIPVCYSGLRIQVLSPMIPLKALYAIEKMPVRYGRSPIPNGFDSWRAFTKRNHGLRWSSLSLDKGIACLVKAMSEAGILVTGGCDGHGKHKPRIYFASMWAAAWFHVVYERINAKHLLHYTWKVVIPEGGNGSPCLQAIQAEGMKWSERWIRQDALTMALMMREWAEQLRELRRTSFKNRSMRKESEALAHDFEALCQWMTDKLDEKEAAVHA
ncbi:hypothetical protein [Paenibacillus sp. UNC451MF]|uniref:hypothetical protein n=1 Tax=Paenibacillus sp. UNC451MF TaxID=1449063 RepID=UPI00048C1BE6|nr:hypothetical protein [Paenibacillus sp. UNC451MF]